MVSAQWELSGLYIHKVGHCKEILKQKKRKKKKKERVSISNYKGPHPPLPAEVGLFQLVVFQEEQRCQVEISRHESITRLTALQTHCQIRKVAMYKTTLFLEFPRSLHMC